MPTTATAAIRQTRTPAGLLIRELEPSDRRALSFVLRRLGHRSRYLRFHGAKLNVHAELERLTGTTTGTTRR